MSVIKDTKGYEVALEPEHHGEKLLEPYLYYEGKNGLNTYRLVPQEVLEVLTVKHTIFSGRERVALWVGLSMVSARFPVEDAAERWLNGDRNVSAGALLV